MCMCFISRVCFLQPFCKSPWFSNQPRKLIFLVLDSSGLGCLVCDLNLHSPGRISQAHDIPFFLVSTSCRCGSQSDCFSSFLPNSAWIFLYSLGCRRAFCQFVFSENCSTCRCLFMCLWAAGGREVHSASSYSIILITSCQARVLVVAMKKSNTVLE